MRNTAFCVLAIALVLSGCDRQNASPEIEKPPVLYGREKLMDTEVSIQAVAPEGIDRKDLGAAIQAAFDRIREIEQVCSAYIPASDVCRINKAAGEERVEVDAVTFDIVRKAVDIAEKTGGAFDITIGPLVELWEKVAGEAGIAQSPPTSDEIAAALKLVGCRDINKLELTQEDGGRYIHLKKQGMRIDLGGIAKGYAVDEAIKVLREYGIKDAIVEAGGDVCAIGQYPKMGCWQVGARHYAGLNRIFDRWELKDEAVATSSDYERGYIFGGKRHSHIVDPRSGQALTELTSISVFAPDCATADALATAVCVAGCDSRREILQKFPGSKFVQVNRSPGIPFAPAR